MAINVLTAHRLALQRQSKQIREVLQKPCRNTIYYEVHSGIMDYRTGKWIRHDYVDQLGTLLRAREELTWRNRHPKEGQNAAYIIRRYRHGNKDIS